ncbi:MAG: hypothetical protein HZC22_11310 [Rhodocyclales bacterium]|nr:hypothetical protein [Rhodocyclales bacterium]
MEKATSFALQRSEFSANVVRVTIPASAAYDLKQMQKITASILDRLGCSNCHSGHDIRFDLEREFIVDAKLNVHARSELLRG